MKMQKCGKHKLNLFQSQQYYDFSLEISNFVEEKKRRHDLCKLFDFAKSH